MKKLLLLLLPMAIASADEFKRLDPHGASDLDLKKVQSTGQKTECTVCHTKNTEPWPIKAGIGEICMNCHNKAPHSGAADHLGRHFKDPKTQQDSTITCLSCHAPHRASAVAWDHPSGFFTAPITPEAPNGLRKSVSQNPMMRRTCTECHAW